MSVGLPSWDALIDHLLDDLELDRGVIEKMHGGYQILAEYYHLKHGSISPLRSWFEQNWRVSPERVAASELHRLIIDLDFPIIYTTNYDHNLEVAFEAHRKPFAKIANARDIANAADGVTQIVKYHGDFDDDESLVLTETDYLNRLSFDSPLDIKFRSDALGRTILFVGYSMSDPNIRLLLHRIWGTWKRSGHEKDRPQSFVFMPDCNRVQEAVLARWGITAVSEPADSVEQGLVAFLQDIKQRMRGDEPAARPRAAAAQSKRFR